MKNIVAVVWFIGGIVLAIYVGFYLMFVGGIIDIINVCKAPVVDAEILTWGIVKVIFASIVGYLIFFINTLISAGIKES